MSLIEALKQIKFESEKIAEGAQVHPYAELIAYRVLIARLGDSDNNRWWNIAILSPFGKQHLAGFLPTTIQSKRILLAFAACAKVERKTILTKNHISLFNLGLSTERKVSLLLSKDSLVESSIERVLNLVEGIRCILDSPGWTQHLGYEVLVGLDEKASSSHVASVSLGALDEQPSQEDLVEILESLFAGYGNSCRGRLVVPYYEVKTFES